MQAPAAMIHSALIGSPRLIAIPPSANAAPAASASPTSFRTYSPSHAGACGQHYRIRTERKHAAPLYGAAS